MQSFDRMMVGCAEQAALNLSRHRRRSGSSSVNSGADSFYERASGKVSSYTPQKLTGGHSARNGVLGDFGELGHRNIGEDIRAEGNAERLSADGSYPSRPNS